MKIKALQVFITAALAAILILTLEACVGGFRDWFKKNGNADNGENSDTPPVDLVASSVSFSEDTWEVIDTVCKTGRVRGYYNLGDEKEITIGEETYAVQIIGFSHDELTDGTGKAVITLGLKQLLTTHYKMNETNTNEGGWKDSYMRNTNMPLIYNMLPADLQAAINSTYASTPEIAWDWFRG